MVTYRVGNVFRLESITVFLPFFFFTKHESIQGAKVISVYPFGGKAAALHHDGGGVSGAKMSGSFR